MRRLYFLSIRYLAFATFPVGVGGMLLSRQIVLYLYGPEYIEAYRVLQIMFFSSIFTSLANPGAAILYGYERQSFIYKLGMIMAVFNIILDIFLIRWYGAVGAAVCYASTTVIGSTIGTIYTCRTMHLRFPFASLVRITLSTILMAVVIEVILIQIEGVLGFILALVVGGMAYLMSVLVISSTEEEDYSLLSSVKGVLPGGLKKLVDGVVAVIAEFKKGVVVGRE
jgi:O-antigen/teichoic acid export membrane protein